MPSPGNSGVIHDIGYQRYTGPRLGRGYAVRSIYVYSLRTAFGLGRTAKAKLLPAGLFGTACVTALILVVISSQLPRPVLSYVGLVSTFSYGVTVFVAMTAPELVSRDLRNSLMPLYFSRPPRRTDYALAKLAALASAAFIVFAGPLLIMFVGLAFNTTTGIGGVADQAGDLLPGLLAAVVHAVVIAAIALPLAALTGRRVFATGLVMAVFLLTAPVSGVLRELSTGSARQLAGVLDPVSLLVGIDSWLFGEDTLDIGPYGPVYGAVAVALTATATALLIWRYRKVKA